MQLRFNFSRTVQAAATLLKMHPAPRMNYMRLLKLLYIAERELLAQHAQPLTGDQVVGMERGPVLSHTYNLIRGEGEDSAEWSKFIKKDHYDVVLAADPGRGQLSKCIVGKLQEITDRYADLDEWDMVEETHKFEEWRKNFPKDSCSSHPIPWEDALAAQGQAGLAAEIEKDEQASHLFDRLLVR